MFDPQWVQRIGGIVSHTTVKMVYGFFGQPQYPKWFSRNEPDATHRSIYVPGRREKTAFIGQVFLLLLIYLISLSTVGSSRCGSMAEIQ